MTTELLNNLDEKWKPIPNYQDYLVSNLGNVLSLKRSESRLLNPSKSEGYPRVSLLSMGKQSSKAVHCLVMLAFVGPVPNGMEIRHLDGSRDNNRLENLCYGTHKENMADSIRHGTNREASKTHCAKGHLFDKGNTRPRKAEGGTTRVCKICSYERTKIYTSTYPEKRKEYDAKYKKKKKLNIIQSKLEEGEPNEQ